MMKSKRETTSNAPILLSVPETARAWGVSERLVWAALSSGIVPSVKLGRARRISAEVVAQVAREGLPTTGGR